MKKNKILEECRKKMKDCQHRFVIVKGSGKKEGIPTWECVHCPKRVKAS